MYSFVLPGSSGTAVLSEQPAITFKAVDAETLGTMLSPTVTTSIMTSASTICPLGSILSLTSAKPGSIFRWGDCVLCGPGTYSVSPLAGIGTTPKQPACLNCPQTATCKGGSDVIFSLGTWVVMAGMYQLVSCPPNYQLINSDDSGVFQHDLQHCRQCQVGQYILNPNSSDFVCQNCPTGSYLDTCLDFFDLLTARVLILAQFF